jgi:hypothetical protein
LTQIQIGYGPVRDIPNLFSKRKPEPNRNSEVNPRIILGIIWVGRNDEFITLYIYITTSPI